MLLLFEVMSTNFHKERLTHLSLNGILYEQETGTEYEIWLAGG